MVEKEKTMKWILKNKPADTTVAYLQQTCNLPKLIATLLAQRGVQTLEDCHLFFKPTLQDLHDPYLMKDMRNAVKRIEYAMQQNENILVYGDYDVDGTTAVSLVYTYLSTIYPNVATYIPDRYKEGYGISTQGIDFAADNDFSLIIALDCGIRSVDKVQYAKEKGVDFIICDHHLPGDEIPDAIAVLDPKQKDCNYPYKELSGCGVGFKLIQALHEKRSGKVEDLWQSLDLLATSIAADIVPITGENRILAMKGLEVLNNFPRLGLKHFIKTEGKFTIADVVFKIAPKINAAGRIEQGISAVQLLTSQNENEVVEKHYLIENFNSQRRDLDKNITQEALEQIDELNEYNRATTVVYNENWHKGVIGIVASRLIETYYRPTIVFTKSGEVLAASARSIKGYDIYKALDACKEHLIQFGGHKYAAGMTLAPENYQKFKDAFENFVSKTLPEECKEPQILIDVEVNFSELNNQQLLNLLNRMEPCGPENMTPVFLTKNIKAVFPKLLGSDKTHLKFYVQLFEKTETNNGLVEAIFFGGHQWYESIEKGIPIDIVYSISENHWNGETRKQLEIKDVRVSS